MYGKVVSYPVIVTAKDTYHMMSLSKNNLFLILKEKNI